MTTNQLINKIMENKSYPYKLQVRNETQTMFKTRLLRKIYILKALQTMLS